MGTRMGIIESEPTRRRRRSKMPIAAALVLAVAVAIGAWQLLDGRETTTANRSQCSIRQPWSNASANDAQTTDEASTGDGEARAENGAAAGDGTTTDAAGQTNASNDPIGAQKLSSDWNLILVNSHHPLPSDFEVELKTLASGHQVDVRLYPALQRMMDDARAEGLSPIICSSYRTMEKQTSLYNNLVNSYIAKGYSSDAAKQEAAKWIAIPGTSEHHTGLVVDIVAQSYQLLDEKQADTAEQQWLMQNAHKYGFILRYAKDKTAITGIGYEPWHYRYVGEEAAKEMYERGISLEEYLNGR